jgi:hypothetical protein
MLCPYCNQEHPADASFCPVTGKKYDETISCKFCKKLIKKGWKICPECGSPIHFNNPDTLLKDRHGKLFQVSKWFFLAVLSSITFLCIFIFIIFLFDPFNFHLRGRLIGQYDAVAEIMPESTQIYIGINLLHIRQQELDLLTSLLLQPLAINTQDDLSLFTSSDNKNPTNSTKISAIIHEDDYSLNLIPQQMFGKPQYLSGNFQNPLQNKYGVKIPDDLIPWIGQYIGVGIIELFDIEYPQKQPRFLIAAETRNRKAADMFLQKVVDGYVENQHGYFEITEYQGNSIYILSNSKDDVELALCRNNSVVLFALDLKTIKETIGSTNTQTLAHNPAYTNIRKNVPQNELINLFISREALDNWMSMSGPAGKLLGMNVLPPTSITGWKGSLMTVKVIDRHLQLDVYSYIDRQNMNARDRRLLGQPGSPNKTASMLPENTLLYFTGFKADLLIDAFFEDLNRIDYRGEFQYMLKTIEYNLNINLREDFYFFLDEEWAFAIYPTQDSLWSKYEIFDGGYLFLSEIRNKNFLSEAVEAQKGFFIPTYSNLLKVTNINEDPFYELNTTYEEYPDIVLGISGDYLIFSSNAKDVENVFSEKVSLAENETFKKSFSLIKGASPFLFIDMEELTKMLFKDNQNKNLLSSIKSITAFQYPLTSDGIRNSYVIEVIGW